ncbi:MAG: hypothetical protein J2P56_01785 [Verrucomicrobia bacterium]|nr:hypothetical protein [Verrucomicrobiota bacterium]
MSSVAAIGVLIGIGFALAWAIAGLQGVPSPWRALALGTALLISLLIAGAVLWRLRSAQSVGTSGVFNGVVYGWAVSLEAAAILITVIALRKTGLTQYIMPAVAFIVGAHFFGLARAMGSAGRVFIWVGGLMCTSAAVIVVALARSVLSPSQSMAFTGFSCALILWASALSTVI